MIKVYMHYNSLQSFLKGNWVNARIQFAGNEDLEVYLNLKDIKMSYQQTGFTVKKRKWYEKIFRR